MIYQMVADDLGWPLTPKLPKFLLFFVAFLPRKAMLSAVYAVVVCLCVCLCV